MANRNLSMIKEKVRQLPQSPGVYLMKDRFGETLYVGKAKNLKNRVSTYFQPGRKLQITQPKVAAMLDLIHDFEIVEVRNESEALLLEGRLIKEHRPKYNTDFTDDKRFLLVRVDVTRELPVFRLVRFRQDEHSLYYGPFAHSGQLRKTLAEMRQKFGILLADSSPKKLPDGRWQLYDDLRAELYDHGNCITAQAYRERVDAACGFLEGKARDWLKELEKEMTRAAEQLAFEKAAQIRDLLQSLKRTLAKTRKFTRNLPIAMQPDLALTELARVLQLPHAPARMECFDISHISGTFCVASMVVFINGKPDKSQYRRFKIQSFVGNDDFRAMEEVVGRRYKRLTEEQSMLPDLVVIDGGKGQLAASLRAFLQQDIEPPPMIGLAKKEETVIFIDNRPPLQLPIENTGRRLLQQIRDEAHRFANSFNAELRSRKLRETVLDSFPGLGSKRKELLLQHFGSLQKLRSATPDELQQVDGIGPGLSEKLWQFLQGN